MSDALPKIYLARHGETEWSLSGQHTSFTDIPLTVNGERNAHNLGERLRGLHFLKVLTSPLQRAKRTCELAGFGDRVEMDGELVEWNYGEYEGKRTADIRKERPDWFLFRDGCPGGETLAALTARVDRVISRLRALDGDVLLFSHAHFLRVLGARWLEKPVEEGRLYLLTTASLSILGYEHNRGEPVLRLWNDDRHVHK
ncbi:MAG: histidine phosphatase family protein [Gemmataceae bacterium]